MLRAGVVATLIPITLAIGANYACASDGGFDGPAPTQVEFKTGCEHQATPTCVVDLRASRPGADISHPVSAPQPSPPPPPVCHYEQDFTYSPSATAQASGSPSAIAVQHEVCQDGAQQVGTPFAFTPIAPAAPVVNIRALVDQASKAMKIPLPQASLSPAADATQFVGLPLWAWIPASAWVPKSVVVSAGGVSLTMTATPALSVWSMGDGGSMTCRGPGTPYRAASKQKPTRNSPDCGYNYARASSGEPDGVFPGSVTTYWSVSWSTTTGLSGSEPDLSAASALPLHVSEIQALVTDVRP